MRPVQSMLVVGSLSSALLVGTAGPALAEPLEVRWPGIAFAVTKETCMKYYRADSAKCRKLPPIPYVRQACWAAAAGKLAACMARAD